MSAALLLLLAPAFAPQLGAGLRSVVHSASPRMGLFDGLNKGSFYDDDAPSKELGTFQARAKKQQDDFKKISPKLQRKLLKESAAADPEQANRGVIYAIGAVLALVAIGGNGVLYQIDIKPAPVSSDQMREAAEIPGGPAQNQVRPPTFGTSAGTSKPRQ
ncbi:hypothetical protein KFE25_007255 [Diacronema lutheri]|uniref:Uncharacterized protein n=1 Tax=Diacronema lutheri TaxID=2081491 RepID=A0A7R9YLK5_DIALT|nr:hypothetical protein KFE25_007255 [Diacronema lutheri]